ncbi:MAG: T9SS type A sorting domain-containing protein [Bacteroidia bacterium]|jgi:hypothetical protein|nr:T9SS type A sorting domain-containing protein [Bacteroidia bacterium]
MKKIYTLLALILGAGSLAAQQTDDGRLHPAKPASASQNSQMQITSFSCDSTGTTLAAGNGNDGIMFDVTAVQNVRITYIDVALDGAGTGNMMIYYKSGTHVGSEGSAGAWTFLDSAHVAFSPTGFVHLPIYINQIVTAGNSIAFYVTSDGGALAVDYTNGTAVGNIYSQDAFIQIREGTGIDYPFGGTFTPRIPNVNINYCDISSVPNCFTDTTTFVSNNGNDGNMFDVLIGSTDVTLRRLYCNVNGTGWWHIYYRSGTYVGNESSSAGWILLDSTYITGAGFDVPTLIPIDMDIYAPAGSTVAFYTTGNGTGADINYTDGTTEGAVYSSNAHISIKEGKGMTWPFGGLFAPRIWNGILEYCVGPTGTAETITTTSNWSVQVMPNPAGEQAQLLITAPAQVENASVRIFDMSGREVLTIGGINSNLVQLPTEQLSSGVYFCQVRDEKGNILCTSKFVRQ